MPSHVCYTVCDHTRYGLFYGTASPTPSVNCGSCTSHDVLRWRLPAMIKSRAFIITTPHKQAAGDFLPAWEMNKTFSHREILHDSDCINLKGYFINADPPRLTVNGQPFPAAQHENSFVHWSLILFTFNDQILASKQVFITNDEYEDHFDPPVGGSKRCRRPVNYIGVQGDATSRSVPELLSCRRQVVEFRLWEILFFVHMHR